MKNFANTLLIIVLMHLGVSVLAQPTLIGTTVFGGPNSAGSIFVMPTGSNAIEKSYFFEGINGSGPESGLLLASNGKLYGTTVQGGDTDEGVLYEFDLATNKVIKLVDFRNIETGKSPYGTLVEASNGKFYGVTWGGGSSDKGVLFEYEPTSNKLIKKVDFVGVNGDNPWSKLTAYKGKFYGTTRLGGVNNMGVLFEFDPLTEVYTKKIDFSEDITSPNFIEFTVSSDNKIYAALFGSTNAAIFEYDLINNALIKIADFATLNSGVVVPIGSMVQVSNGKMYGVSRYGGNTDRGLIFEFDPTTNGLANKYNFAYSASTLEDKGYFPRTLMLSKNGMLYGTTKSGGAGSGGVLFEYDYSSNTYTKKIDFKSSQNGSTPDNLSELCFTPVNSGTIVTSKQEICQGDGAVVSVSLSSITESTSYSWSLPAGSIIMTGENTNSLSIDFNKVPSGNYVIKAAGKNACGNGPFTSISLTIYNIPIRPTITVDYSNPELPLLTSSDASTYQWFKNEIMIEGAVSKKHLVTSEGEYSVVVTNTNECFSIPSSLVAIFTTGSANSKEEINVELYPNPTRDWLAIECEGIDVTRSLTITVSDHLGKKVVVKVIKYGQGVNVQNLHPGHYVLQLIQGKRTKIWRFIKE